MLDTPSRSRAYFPSKLVEYLGARKPILAITQKGSFVSRLMDEWKQPWCDIVDVDAIAACLKRVANRELWPPPPPNAIDAFIGSQVSARLGAVLSEVINLHPADNGGADENANAESESH